MASNAISLRGEITSAEREGGTLTFDVDVGQDAPARFQVPIVSRNAAIERAGQSMLSRICCAAGVFQLKDEHQLIGHELTVRVIQPSVADGLLRPLVVVGVAP